MSAGLGTIIVTAFKELLGKAVDELKSKRPELTAAQIEKLVDDAVERAVTAAVAEIDDSIRRGIDALGVQVALNHLDSLLRNTDDWFRPKGLIPNLGISVEEVTDDPAAEPPK